MAALSGSESGVHGIALRKVMSGWEEDTASWDLRPISIDIGVDADVGGEDGRFYTWDVTGLVQDWLDGESNYGLALWSDGETTHGWRGFASRESDPPPRLLIEYQP